MSQLVASVTDNCGSVSINDVVITQVSSDEPEHGNGDGNTFNDIVIAGNCKSVQLRSERSGNDNGRVYTLTFKLVDSSGNVRIASRTVTVPKASAVAVDDGLGAGYTVISSCGP
jgi:hypothetical protein